MIALPAFCRQLNIQYHKPYWLQEKGLEHTLNAPPTFYCQFNNQYPISDCLQSKGTYLEAFLDCTTGLLLTIKHPMSYIILPSRKGLLKHTWKPCLTALPNFYCRLNNQHPISCLLQSKGTYLEAFLDCTPSFLLSIK